MTNPAERFAQRHAILAAAPKPQDVALTQAIPATMSWTYVNAPDYAKQFALDSVDHAAHAQQILAELADVVEQGRFQATMQQLKHDALMCLVNQFGLGKLVAAYDKTGGSVDTTHNVRGEIYATREEEDRFENRPSYNERAYHNGNKQYRIKTTEVTNSTDGELTDTYSGKPFTGADKAGGQTKPTVDHIIAAKNIHNDRARVLAELNGPDLANIDDNLAIINQSTNGKKGTLKADQLGEYLNREAEWRRERITELNGKQGQLDEDERKELTKLEIQENIDIELVKKEETRAAAAIDEKIDSAYYSSSKFWTNTGLTSASEGVKIGMQQAFGQLLVEFFAAAFDEMNDLYQHGKLTASLAREARLRLRRVASRVADKWKDVLASFGQGFLTGLLSNLVTVLINTFVTTGKRAVRMIREGLLSLLRALKLVLLRPKDITPDESLHAASKLLVAGGAVAGGIMVEQAISDCLALLPAIGAIIEPLTAALVSVLTAMVTGLLIYGLDKADLFSVNARECDKKISVLLDASIAESVAAIKHRQAALEQAIGFSGQHR